MRRGKKEQKHLAFVFLDLEQAYAVSSLALQTIFNMKYDHPILAKSLEQHLELTRDWKGDRFCLDSWHVGNRENSVADSAAKNAFEGDISDELTAFSDLNPRVNK